MEKEHYWFLCSAYQAMEDTLKYIGERISYQEDQERLSMVILGKEGGNRPMLRLIWFIAWLLIGALVFQELGRLDPEAELRVVLFVFLGFWAYYLFRILRALYWQWKGRESLLLKKDELMIKEAFSDLGKAFRHPTSKVFPMEDRVKELGFFALFEDSFWSIGRGELQFQVNGRTYYFGKSLSQEELDALKKLFNKKLKEFQVAND